MTGLVYVGKVLNLSAIPEADKIELATVVCGKGGKWRGIVQKGCFQTEDVCQVYLPDCIVPDSEEFEFMKQYKHRVRQVKFRGVPSECLIMPQVIPGGVGEDITIPSGVSRYHKPIPVSLAGAVRGTFPPFIPRTDEPNYQSVPEMIEALIGQQFYSTEKVDGTSVTMYWNGEHFGCCSRNIELKEDENNAIWQIARQYQIKEKLQEYGVPLALQMELAGPKIQGNPMGLSEITPYVFNLYDITNRCYYSSWITKLWLEWAKLPMVKILDWNQLFTQDYVDMLPLQAEGEYANGHQREGIVIRSMYECHGDRLSFKVMNLLYREE